jgi:hypothetical protein
MNARAGHRYLRISQFSETTGADTKRRAPCARAAGGRDLRGLVLDLRNNPGGVLGRRGRGVGRHSSTGYDRLGGRDARRNRRSAWRR